MNALHTIMTLRNNLKSDTGTGNCTFFSFSFENLASIFSSRISLQYFFELFSYKKTKTKSKTKRNQVIIYKLDYQVISSSWAYE